MFIKITMVIVLLSPIYGLSQESKPPNIIMMIGDGMGCLVGVALLLQLLVAPTVGTRRQAGAEGAAAATAAEDHHDEDQHRQDECHDAEQDVRPMLGEARVDPRRLRRRRRRLRRVADRRANPIRR